MVCKGFSGCFFFCLFLVSCLSLPVLLMGLVIVSPFLQLGCPSSSLKRAQSSPTSGASTVMTTASGTR